MQYLLILILIFAYVNNVIPQRYVLTFVNNSIAQAAGLHIVAQHTEIVKQYGRRLILSTNSNVTQETIISHYEESFEIIDIEEDALVYVLLSNSSEIEKSSPTAFMEKQLYGIQYPLVDTSIDNSNISIQNNDIEWQYSETSPYGIQVERLWAFSNGSLKTRIAILDSGVAEVARQNDWFVNLEKGYDFITDLQLSLDGNGRDSNSDDPGDSDMTCPISSWHGTKMAFAAAGKHTIFPGLHSVAWNTTILPLRVLGLCGSGYANDVTDAIVWAAGGLINGLGTNPNRAQIISMSFGGRGKCPSFLQSAIWMAIKEFGTIVVVSAGNEGLDSSDYFPVNCEGVIRVAASTKAGHIAPYSNTGNGISLSAAGGDMQNPIQSLTFDSIGIPTLSKSWGSSFSSIFVSGVIALVVQLLTPDSIFDNMWILEQMTSPFNGNDPNTLKTCTLDDKCGMGILNLALWPQNQTCAIDKMFVNKTKSNVSGYIETSAAFAYPIQIQSNNLMVHHYAYDTLGNYGVVSSSAMGGGTLTKVYDGIGDLSQWSLYPYNFGTTCSATPTLAWIQYDLGTAKAISWIFILPYTDVRTYCYLSLQISWTGTFTGEQEIVFACGMTSGTYCPVIPYSGLNVSLYSTMGRYVRWSMGGSNLACCTGSFFIQFLVGSYTPNWCQAGTYYTGTGFMSSSLCTRCEAGKYSVVQNARSSSVCMNCEEGKYSASGSVSCLKNGSEVFALVMEGNGLSCNGGPCLRHINLKTREVRTYANISMSIDPGKGSFFISQDAEFTLIADSYNQVIKKLYLKSGIVEILAGKHKTVGYVNGLGVDARFYFPMSIAMHPNLTFALIADQDNNAIRKLTMMNQVYNVFLFAGSCGTTSPCTAGGGDNWVLQATFNKPSSVVIDPSGSFAFVSEWGGCKIRKIDFFNGRVGFHVSTFAGSGTCVTSATNLIGTSTTFGSIWRLKYSVDANSLFVIDDGTQSIRTTNKHSSITSTRLNVGISKSDADSGTLGNDVYFLKSTQVFYSNASLPVPLAIIGSGNGLTVDGIGTSASLNYPLTIHVWRINIPGFGSHDDPFVQVLCPAGTYSSSTGMCVKCSPGNISFAGSTSCTPCPQGQISSSDNTLCISCANGFSSHDKSVCTYIPDLPLGYWNVSDLPSTVIPTNWYYCNAACCCGPPPGETALPVEKGITKWDNKGYGAIAAYLWVPIGNPYFNNDELVVAARWGPGSMVYVSIKSGSTNYFKIPTIDSSVCFVIMGVYWTKSNWGSYQHLGYDVNNNGQIETSETGPGFYNSYASSPPDALIRADATTVSYAYPVNYPFIHSRIVINICSNTMIYQVQGVGPDKTPFSQWVNYGAWTNANLDTTASNQRNPYLWNGILTTASADAFRYKMVYVKAFKKGYTFQSDQIFQPCSPGTYWLNSQTCLSCPSNTTSIAGSLALTDCFTMPGFYGVSGSTIQVCPINNYCPVGTVNPIPCPNNTYSVAGASSIDNCTCVVNTYRNSTSSGECLNCSNSYSTFGLTGATVCKQCKSGTYLSSAEATSCTLCSQDLYSLPGSNSILQCIDFVSVSAPTYYQKAFAIKYNGISGVFGTTWYETTANLTWYVQWVPGMSLHVSWSWVSLHHSGSGDYVYGYQCTSESFTTCTHIFTYGGYLSYFGNSGIYPFEVNSGFLKLNLLADGNPYISDGFEAYYTIVCYSCPAGTYKSTVHCLESASICTPCTTTGTYCPYGSTQVQLCSSCSVGTYQTKICTNTSNTECSPCTSVCSTPGTFERVACNASTDRICDSCTNVVTNAVYSGVGTSSGNCPWVCNSGYYLINQSCSACPVNHWCSENILNACPLNSGSSMISTGMHNCICFAGYYGDGSINGPSSCAICSAGHYCPGGNAIVICPQYFTSNAGSDDIGDCFCKPGYQLIGSICELCPRQGFCVNGALSLCPTNSLSNPGSSNISECQCKSGFFGPSGSACSQCPVNSFSVPNSKTLHDCRCNAGYFCLYSKSVSAVISMNKISVNAFNQDTGGVRTAFVNAIARAAGVDISRVRIVNVTSMSTSRRRLLNHFNSSKPKTESKIVIHVLINGESHHPFARPINHHSIRVANHLRGHNPMQSVNFHIEEWKVNHDIKISQIRA